MFRNYLVIALRNFRRNKIFTIITLLGLSVGISSALVIFLIVNHGFSFDKFEQDGGRIYRVVTDKKMAGEPWHFSGVPIPLANVVKHEMTGIQQVVWFEEFYGLPKVSINKGDGKGSTTFKTQGDIIFTEKPYFDMLSYQWKAGGVERMSEPWMVVLTEKRARQYFPGLDDASIIGKPIVYNDSLNATVTGIVKDLAENSDFHFQEFISIASLEASSFGKQYSLKSWGSISSSTQLFIKLLPGAQKGNIEGQLQGLIKKYDPTANSDNKNTTEFRLQPLDDLHFDSTVYGSFSMDVASRPALYGLLAVATFLLMLGCINYINLTTAQSSQRAREIGIRKTMGGSARQIMLQFLSETFLITLVATILSIMMVPVLMNVFSDFVPEGLKFDLLHQPRLMLFLIALVILVTFLSGFYPALVISRYRPVLALKNQVYTSTGSSRTGWIRRGLIVSQFFIAQFFIMATFISIHQINFMIHSDLGFKKDAILCLSTPFHFENWDKPDNRRMVLYNELSHMPGIERVSLGSAAPSSSGYGASTMTYQDGKKEIKADVQSKEGDSNYLPLFHIALLAGRNVDPRDSVHEFLINETLMHILGFVHPSQALNKELGHRRIVGVVADFHQQSMRNPIKPLVFSNEYKMGNGFFVALKAPTEESSWDKTIHDIGQQYKKLYPEESFHYEFFDETIAKLYQEESKTARLLQWASGLSIFISCLGLFGLVIFITNVRTREIGVRKVLGAAVHQIMILLSREFVVLVLIAFAMATPLAWWAMHKWLQDFAYRTPVSWWLFLGSGFLLTAIAFLTMSIHTYRAAMANPVKSLRSD